MRRYFPNLAANDRIFYLNSHLGQIAGGPDDKSIGGFELPLEGTIDSKLWATSIDPSSRVPLPMMVFMAPSTSFVLAMHSS